MCVHERVHVFVCACMRVCICLWICLNVHLSLTTQASFLLLVFVDKSCFTTFITHSFFVIRRVEVVDVEEVCPPIILTVVIGCNLRPDWALTKEVEQC